MRIVIADDHMIVRRGLQLILAKRPEWHLAEASNSDELFEIIRHEEIDIVVMDLALRGRSGMDILDQLRREKAEIPVLILSSRPEKQYALPSLRAGARGYVEKDATAEEIIDAIERVANGRIWISTAIGEALANDLLNPSDRAPHELLSPRELEVFRLIATGCTMSEVAAAMNISIKTASTYRARILQKMAFRTNAEIIAYAIRAHLV